MQGNALGAAVKALVMESLRSSSLRLLEAAVAVIRECGPSFLTVLVREALDRKAGPAYRARLLTAVGMSGLRPSPEDLLHVFSLRSDTDAKVQRAAEELLVLLRFRPGAFPAPAAASSPRATPITESPCPGL